MSCEGRWSHGGSTRSARKRTVIFSSLQWHHAFGLAAAPSNREETVPPKATRSTFRLCYYLHTYRRVRSKYHSFVLREKIIVWCSFAQQACSFVLIELSQTSQRPVGKTLGSFDDKLWFITGLLLTSHLNWTNSSGAENVELHMWKVTRARSSKLKH